MKSARLEWCLGNLTGALQTIQYGLGKFPEFPKFYLMKGQIELQQGHKQKAHNTYDLGIKRCPSCIPLWVSLATLEIIDDNITKARSILEKARVRNPLNDELWVHAVRLEVKAGNDNPAQALLARALQTCPKSGILWSECIFMAPRPARKTKSVDGLKNCDNDANVSYFRIHLMLSTADPIGMLIRASCLFGIHFQYLANIRAGGGPMA